MSRHKRSTNRERRSVPQPRTNRGDLPLPALEVEALGWMADGYFIFQKFTCDLCRSRQFTDRANVLYTSASCEQCGFVTDLVARGAGLLSVVTGSTCADTQQHTRLVRRCETCQHCPRCSGTPLQFVGGRRGVTLVDASLPAGVSHGLWRCERCLARSAAA